MLNLTSPPTSFFQKQPFPNILPAYIHRCDILGLIRILFQHRCQHMPAGGTMGVPPIYVCMRPAWDTAKSPARRPVYCYCVLRTACYCTVRLFYGVLIGCTCPAITVVTVILRALDRVRERALGCFARSPKSQYGCVPSVSWCRIIHKGKKECPFSLTPSPPRPPRRFSGDERCTKPQVAPFCDQKGRASSSPS